MKLCLAGRKLGYTFDDRNFHNVSLGQGQEVVAEKVLDLAAHEGHWVILQVKAQSLVFHLTFTYTADFTAKSFTSRCPF